MKSSKLCSILVACLTLTLGGCFGSSSDHDANGSGSAENGNGSGETEATSILAQGGAGALSGGTGGKLEILSFGDVKLSQSGTVDTSITLPAIPPADPLDTDRLVIDKDTTITCLKQGDQKPAAGVPYLTPGTGLPAIMISNGVGTVDYAGDSGDTSVSGLTVKAGATLTLGPNRARNVTELPLFSDLIINGQVKTTPAVTQLWIGHSGTTLLGPQGIISATCPLEIRNYGGLIFMLGKLSSTGSPIDIINQTMPNKSMPAGGGIYLSGSINSAGGAITIDNFSGDLCNAASISASSATGAAGTINLKTTMGSLINNGNLTANGADLADTTGGAGGFIELSCRGGELRSSGVISALGGKGSAGGAGGTFKLLASDFDASHPTGPIRLSGKVSLNGGQGLSGDGGQGGLLYISSSTAPGVKPDNIELVGYTEAINLKGGQGGATGGHGGECLIKTIFDANIAGGAIQNAINIIAEGANGTSQGGNGGHCTLETHRQSDKAPLTNSGNLSVASGAGATGGTSSGQTTLKGWGVVNSGTLNATGGTSTGSEPAGEGGSFWISSKNAAEKMVASAINTGKILVQGGASTGSGAAGEGGGMLIEGASVNVKGVLDASGGKALGGGTAGRGGIISIDSLPNTPLYGEAELITVLDGDGIWRHHHWNEINVNGTALTTGKLPK